MVKLQAKLNLLLALLSNSNQSQKDDIRRVDAAITELRHELQETLRRLDTATAELRRERQEDHRRLETAMAELRRELQEDHRRLETAMAELPSDVKTNIEDIARLQKEVRDARLHLGNVEENCKQVAEVSTQLLQSTSWRLTSPLRMIGRLVKGRS